MFDLWNLFILILYQIFQRYAPPKETVKKVKDTDALATGFLFDDTINNVLYVEAKCNGIVRELYKMAEDLAGSNISIMYGSNYFFSNRLYADFGKAWGVTRIGMVIPLQTLMSNIKVYIPGNVPLPCFQVKTLCLSMLIIIILYIFLVLVLIILLVFIHSYFNFKIFH